LAIVPHASWHARLRGLLSAYPHALVGEIGIDRAAVIPGSRARVRFDHQLALLREQLALAAELSRPVSIHCVRGYGHLLQLFAALPASGAGCPPAVMLHSYGGSPEDVARFCRLPGIGRRFFFSFSAAINARAPDKLVARVRAVPDDRLLVESDQVGHSGLLMGVIADDEGQCTGGHGAQHIPLQVEHMRAGTHLFRPARTCSRWSVPQSQWSYSLLPPQPGVRSAGGGRDGRHLLHRGRCKGLGPGGGSSTYTGKLQCILWDHCVTAKPFNLADDC
jgi:hypothetical protein